MQPIRFGNITRRRIAGKKRIEFKVLNDGQSSINFLDTNGKIINSLSSSKKL
jgi:hypothetical protein